MEIRKLENLKFGNLGNSKTPKSVFFFRILSFPIFKFPSFPIFRFPSFQVLKFSSFQVFKFSSSGGPRPFCFESVKCALMCVALSFCFESVKFRADARRAFVLFRVSKMCDDVRRAFYADSDKGAFSFAWARFRFPLARNFKPFSAKTLNSSAPTK